MKPLYAHLHRWKTIPFVWGESDCMMVIADYLLEMTGVDCAAHLRGEYWDRMSCARLTSFHKDPVAVFEDCVNRIPLDEASKPQEGDIGVVRADYSEIGIGSICLGKTGNWAAKTEGALIIGKPLSILKAWSVPAR